MEYPIYDLPHSISSLIQINVKSIVRGYFVDCLILQWRKNSFFQTWKTYPIQE